ncbi:hypothetical protein AB0I72_24610 [Nocardiopsis sp. NPDC049922]|uniref:hypothetical protein n=1 Tax=Nocardiopsis sp. NPDC049922 TaxID=3155157 RepID=UPI0033D27E23
MPDDTYHQIHFAWAEPTLLGRIGPGPAASSFPEDDQPALRSWRDRLLPALTADYRAALPDMDPADHPETLWARAYPDGQAALVYRWPGEVHDAHAWAIVGPAHGLTFPRVLSLHENPHTRPAASRSPRPGWATMDALPTPEPWERTAAPGAVRTRDRHAAEAAVSGEPVLVGAVAAALARPDLPVHIALDARRADLWQAVQLRFLWGVHRVLRDVLTPSRAIPAAGWSWSFSTYDPVLGTGGGQHLAFGPPADDAGSPFLHPPAPEYLAVAESLVAMLRDEGGDVLAEHLRDRGVPDGPTFADRRALLCDWLAPKARPLPAEPEPRADAADRPGPTDGPVRGGVAGPSAETVTADDDLPDLDDVPEPEWLPPEYEPPADLYPTDPPEPANFPEPADLAKPFDPPDPGDPSEPVSLRDPANPAESVDLWGPSDPPEPANPAKPADRSESAALWGPTDPPETTNHADPADLPESLDLPDLPEVEAPEIDDLAEPASPPLWPLADREPREPLATPAPRPHPRAPEDAPPLGLAPDYATETALDPDEVVVDEDPGDNWPTQYADLPLARLERWHTRRGPEAARVDVVDARAAVRAERAELQRVREERDRYHAEVQDLRRDVARLDRPWLDTDRDEPVAAEPPRRRRTWVLVLLLVAALVVGLETGALSGAGVTDLLALVWGALPFG